MFSTIKNPKIGSLNDCSHALMSMLETQPQKQNKQPIQNLEKISRITRQFEKAFVMATVSTAFLSLNLFIGSVCLLCTSGISFLVPLTLSVGSALLTVDCLTAKKLTSKLRKGVKQIPNIYDSSIQNSSKDLFIAKWREKIKKVDGEFADLLVVPNPSFTNLVSFKHIVSFFLAKQAAKLIVVEDDLTAGKKKNKKTKVKRPVEVVKNVSKEPQNSFSRCEKSFDVSNFSKKSIFPPVPSMSNTDEIISGAISDEQTTSDEKSFHLSQFA